ncbi:MAG: glycosyltransferase family 2 protein [Bacteroidales bacterium]
MYSLFIVIDKIIFVIMAVTVCYLLLFSLFSLKKGGISSFISTKKARFLILIPAYKEDSVIMDSVNSVLAQDYPKEKMDIVVISDKMSDDTNSKLSELSLKLFAIDPKKSSKGYAMNYAMENINDANYNLVVVLDADNVVDKDFLSNLNNAFNRGSLAIQAHRVAKNINSEVALLDAISEEINNSIFRRGHVNMGLSSALIGSGMAIEYKWFRANSGKLVSAGEDKELEILLLKDHIYIDYLDHVLVYDHKIEKEGAFYNQRRRWLAAQLWSLSVGLKHIPKALLRGNFDYVDKIFQWILLPRIVVVGLISIMSVVTLFVAIELSIKWWIILLLLLFAFAAATPDYLITKKTSKAIKRLPLLFILMVFNMFRLKGASKNFIHTKKG